MASRQVSLVLSGGIALGAYHAGAYSALQGHRELAPEWLAGSSIGAVTAALIAGCPQDERLECLRAFWERVSLDPPATAAPWLPVPEHMWRHGYNWLSVMQTRAFGRDGLFQPRWPCMSPRNIDSLYDLAPLRTTLERLVDFSRLNGGDLRVSVAATDVETGQGVVFDTGRGDRIGMDHLLASCGFLPDFAPLDIGGRLLGDGGLAANAPVEAVLLEPSARERLCFVLDLFSPMGTRPAGLEEATARRWELIFGNQTRRALEGVERELRLSRQLAQATAKPTKRGTQAANSEPSHGAITVLHLAYRPPRYEAGPEKPFDFSRATLAQRWSAGSADMAEAILRAAEPAPETGIAVHRIGS